MALIMTASMEVTVVKVLLVAEVLVTVVKVLLVAAVLVTVVTEFEARVTEEDWTTIKAGMLVETVKVKVRDSATD